MTGKLSGKIALVTGGSAGIGLGIAKRLAEEGARVFVTGRRQSELEKAVTAIGGGATAVPGDISNLDDLDRIYETIKARAGVSTYWRSMRGITNSAASAKSPRSISTRFSTPMCAACCSRSRRRCRC